MDEVACGCGCSLGLLAVRTGVAVIKAKQVVPEYADIEVIQDAMAAALFQEWAGLAEAGIAAAEAHIKDLPAVTEAAAKAAIVKLKAPFQAWPSKAAVAMVEESVASMYKLAQNVILNKHMGTKGYAKDLVFKAKLEASFNTVDQEAVAALGRQQVMWLREHYGADVQGAIDASALLELNGLHGKDAAEQLRKEAERILGVGSSRLGGESYFSGVAINTATTARVNGSILEMSQLGIERYIITNPMDDRTTDICADLNGKEFTVKEAADRVIALGKAEAPDDIKALHPWNPGSYKETFDKLGVERGQPFPAGAAAALSAAGYSIPPYHFRCRTTVDVAEAGGGVVAGSGTTAVPEPEYVNPIGAQYVNPADITYKSKALAPGNYNPTALADALDKLTLKPNDVEAQIVVRQQLNSLLAKHGVVSQDAKAGLAGAKKYVTRDRLPGAAATHGWDGTITMRSDYHRDLVAYLRGDAKKAHGMTIFIHEGMHGASGIDMWLYSTRPGVILEESFTELSARHVMMKEVGGLPHGGFWAYNNEIKLVATAYREACAAAGVDIPLGSLTGWTEGSAVDYAARSSIAVKTQVAGKAFKKHVNPVDLRKEYVKRAVWPEAIANDPKALKKATKALDAALEAAGAKP